MWLKKWVNKMLIKEKLGSRVLGEKMLGQNLFDLKKKRWFQKTQGKQKCLASQKVDKKKGWIGF